MLWKNLPDAGVAAWQERFQLVAGGCRGVRGAVGFEHSADSSGNRSLSTQGGTESGTLTPTPARAPAATPALPPDLAGLIQAWATMPLAMRAGIAAMVQAAKGTRTGETT